MEETLHTIPPSSYPNQEMTESSAENSPKFSLPNELIMEILTWLPAKTLVRFWVVSKSWRAAISAPEFIKSHLRNASSRDDYRHHRVLFRCMNSRGDLKGYDYSTRYFPLSPALLGPVDGNPIPIESTLVEDPVMVGSGSKIVGSSNGLFCVCIRKQLFFWNPAISKFKKLPEFDANSNQYCTRRILFEYDEVDDDYKVYVVAGAGAGAGAGCGSGGYWIDVYSGNLNSWRRIEGFALGDWPAHGFSLARGKLYWGKRTSKGAEIACFDMKSETFGVVEQPKYRKGKFDFHFVVLDGCLALCCYYCTSHVDLWIMKEHGVKELGLKCF